MTDFNSLSTNAFTFNLLRMPETTFRCVSAEVPSISVPAPEQNSAAANQWFPGSATEFDQFSVKFIVDENLLNYQEIYHWITQQRYGIGADWQSKSEFDKLLVSDGFLTTLTNNSNPNKVFYFKDMFPVSLGSLAFDVEGGSAAITCFVTFRFSYFELR